MKIFVAVKTNAKADRVKRMDEAHLQIAVKAPPREGKANQAVIEVLSEYFNVPKSSVSILTGKTSKQKIIQIKKIFPVI